VAKSTGQAGSHERVSKRRRTDSDGL
jgi:hypothetical protein